MENKTKGGPSVAENIMCEHTEYINKRTTKEWKVPTVMSKSFSLGKSVSRAWQYLKVVTDDIDIQLV